jgi:predicted nuclease of predicted toxin-antitoxin system
VRIKLDENITIAVQAVLIKHGHDVHTVHGEGLIGAPDSDLLSVCRNEQRMLVTFDLGFGDLRAYPPGTHPGVIVLRLDDQQPEAVLDVMERLVTDQDLDQLKGCLLVVNEDRVRIRRA